MKMELFVLLGDIDNQLECLGVYESREAARAAARVARGIRDVGSENLAALAEDDPSIEDFVIERREVGATPKWGFMQEFRENLDPDAYSK